MTIFSRLFTVALFTVSSFVNASLINLQHIDHLYEERVLDTGEKIGLIHIYSEYPDYEWVKDPLEGTSALDDIARAMLVYSNAYALSNDDVHYDKIAKLVRSMLYLHAENGYFYNFIYPDNTINKTYKTSVAEANWWTWRAILALSYSYEQVLANDKILAEKVHRVLFNSIEATYANFNFEDEGKVDKNNGFNVPKWINHGGSDQAAILLLGLTKAYKISPNENITKMMRSLAKGIMTMQVKNVHSDIHGAMMDWENIWHAYGSDQSYALLEAGMLLEDRMLVKAAFVELNHFHPYLIEQGFLNWFSAKQDGETITFLEKGQFDQIAYGFRPMIMANLKAYEISRDTRYIEQAVAFAMWFFGENAGGVQMYSPVTGRVFDGLSSAKSYNRNSGAESTIEALLALAAIENSPLANKLLQTKLKDLATN